MKKLLIKLLIVNVMISLSLVCLAPASWAEDEKTGETEKVEKTEKAGNGKKDSLMERIDFGNSYILGQSIKSGSTYLLHRKKSDIKSMLKTREDYRKEILEDFKVKKDS